MDVVIHSDCSHIPESSTLLNTQGTACLNFLTCLGFDALNPPLADVLRQLNHLEGKWFVVSPVHWQASHNDAFIVAAGKDLHLSETECKTWFELFAAHLVHDGLRLHYHSDDLWLLSNDQMIPLNAKPVHQIMQKSLMPELAALDPSMHWQKFITESQMFFASHPNETPLNGIWLWGGVPLGEKKSIAVCADEHFFELANICSSNVSLYTPAVALKQFDIILLNNNDILSQQHISELNRSAHWYWNNTAYTQSDSNWLTRLWRNLIHAH